ncbi:MAG: hypothetical protein GTO63_16535 [Anaerolineae bacterium]|nr:hypothetical protein [Anaerolineae bacterium]NIN96418.1 hypothetical protein [Anaerolineae bacterium]NIQ79454.1 hypothetical protein [Anaerolineae bacterium]
MRGLALLGLLFVIPLDAWAQFSVRKNERRIVEPVTVSSSSVVVVESTGAITAIGEYTLFSANISVSGGTGFSVFSSTGMLEQCAIIPPSDTSNYAFEIATDPDAFPVTGGVNFTGTISLASTRIILGAHTATISDASEDGTYKTRCTLRR